MTLEWEWGQKLRGGVGIGVGAENSAETGVGHNLQG